jgi:2-polyprenyl-6-methoxyphenol hydroxylase-like FAD-dependent oxidoreductase
MFFLMERKGLRRGVWKWEADDWGRMLNVPRKTYQRVLYEAAVREGVDVRFGCRVEKIEDGGKGPSVTLTTGETIECDLIVGADGMPFPPLHSPLL